MRNYYFVFIRNYKFELYNDMVVRKSESVKQVEPITSNYLETVEGVDISEPTQVRKLIGK